MAALLARAEARRGASGGRVLVVQRDSPTSRWKVPAINAVRSPIGGVEPGLDAIVAEMVAAERLSASHEMDDLADAASVLVCVQTDKRGLGPDYDPLYEALDALAHAFHRRRSGAPPPLVIIESTLAPSSMTTLVRERFARHGLLEGRDLRLGNSPNRVMPGRLVERVESSDKLVAGLSLEAAQAIADLYQGVVTGGTLHVTNSLTAEIVKTLENAYRDVRIAFAAEVVRWCDAHDVDFFALRDAANALLGQSDGASGNSSVVPSGGVLVPSVGVGGHCLPKDGILLWWRHLESGDPASAHSLILESRRINDEAPALALEALERRFGAVRGRIIAVLGAAYRADSEDTRNSPALDLAALLRDAGARIIIHDPHVRPGDQNLDRRGLGAFFTNDLSAAVGPAALVVVTTAHREYRDGLDAICAAGRELAGIFDACNLVRPEAVLARGIAYAGIGRGHTAPEAALARGVADSFRLVERGVAREVELLIAGLNGRFALDEFSRSDIAEVRRLAGTCVTGCSIPDPTGPQPPVASAPFAPRLVGRMMDAVGAMVEGAHTRPTR